MRAYTHDRSTSGLLTKAATILLYAGISLYSGLKAHESFTATNNNTLLPRNDVSFFVAENLVTRTIDHADPRMGLQKLEGSLDLALCAAAFAGALHVAKKKDDNDTHTTDRWSNYRSARNIFE